MNKSELTRETFKGGFNCSQSVFSSFAEDFGMDRETALKVAGCFGGGMGRMGEVCGALTGALMALGLKLSAGGRETDETKVRMYGYVRELAGRFRERHGAICCRELLGVDIDTTEGHDLAVRQGLFISRCPTYVMDAASMLEDMLKEIDREAPDA